MLALIREIPERVAKNLSRTRLQQVEIIQVLMKKHPPPSGNMCSVGLVCQPGHHTPHSPQKFFSSRVDFIPLHPMHRLSVDTFSLKRDTAQNHGLLNAESVLGAWTCPNPPAKKWANTKSIANVVATFEQRM